MLKDLLGKDREILLMASEEILNQLDRFSSCNEDALLIYYSIEDNTYSTTACKVSVIIPETAGSDEYAHRQYTIINLSEDEEAKLLVLIDLGMDMIEAIVSFTKEEDIKWLYYSEE